MNGLNKAFWAVLAAVLVAFTTYLVNSKSVTTGINSKIDAVDYRVEVIEDRVNLMGSTVMDLKVSRATTDAAISNLEAIAEKIEQVTDKLYITVTILEERSKSQ